MLFREQHPAVNYAGVVTEISKVHILALYRFTRELTGPNRTLKPRRISRWKDFAFQVVRTAFLSSDAFQSVTVRAQKPSALTFARSSGVEITRLFHDPTQSPMQRLMFAVDSHLHWANVSDPCKLYVQYGHLWQSDIKLSVYRSIEPIG